MEQNIERVGPPPGGVPANYESGKGCLVLTLLVAGLIGLMLLSVVLLGDPSPTAGVAG